MSDWRRPPLDDRVTEVSPQQLREHAAHVIDVVRANVRYELDGDADAAGAVLNGVVVLEGWLRAVGEPSMEPPELYALRVEAALVAVHDKLGAAGMWAWLREPNDVLDGRTPLAALVKHSSRAVAALARDMPDPLAETAAQP